MENRFGFKDLVVVVLLLAVLVMIFLAMLMFNHQYAKIQTIAAELQEQKSVQARVEKNIADLQRQITDGGAVADTAELLAAIRQMQQAGDTTDNTQEPLTVAAESDPFARIEAAHDHGDYAPGDWLVDAFGAKVAKITPLVSGDVYGSRIQSHVLQSLAERDPVTLEFTPMLARSWKVENNLDAWQAYVEQRKAKPLTEQEIRSEAFFQGDEQPSEEDAEAYIAKRLAEGRRTEDIAAEADCPPAVLVHFRIRKGILFSDGEPMDADDVVYSWELIQNPQIDAPRARAYYSNIKAVEATDDYTVTVSFKEPYFEYFGMAGSLTATPRHFYEQFDPQTFNSQPGLLLGTGPYRMDNPRTWKPGDPLILYRNERFWGPTPSFDRLVYKEITNDVARLTEFKNGGIDRFGATPTQYVELVEDPRILEKADTYNFKTVSSGYAYVAWAQERLGKPTRFADPRVRRAMTLLIDRQRLVDDILKGYGQVVSGPFNPLSEQYNDSFEPWPYDPKQARALLKQAGYEDRDGDGVIEDKDGKPFKFELLYPSGSDNWTRISLLIKDGMAKAGIICDARGLEWSVFGETLASGDLDAIALGWSAGVETDIYQMFHSDNIGGGADNFIYYRNAELDAVIEQARRTLDEQERMKLWNQAHAIMHEDQPYTFLYTRESLLFIDKRIRNIERTRLGLNEIYEWYVPQSLQKY